MRIDEHLLEAFIVGLDLEGRGLVAPAGAEFRRWLRARNLPERLTHFLSRYSPREELWAGAAALFTERRIMKFNDDFPSALESGLLLLGSALNGDWIAVDVREGAGRRATSATSTTGRARRGSSSSGSRHRWGSSCTA